MQNNVVDVLHCEELLKSTLHCDDKEKLRTKLAQLRREYLKTAQKLKRAERLEAVRKHGKDDVPQNEAQRDPEGMLSKPSPAPSSVPLDTVHGFAPCPADSSSSNHVSSIPLPANLEHRDASSPALRLRTRRSRLRWQMQSADVLHSTDESDGRGRSHVPAEETPRFGNERQPSPPESGSPSLLLSHWNSQARTDPEIEEGKQKVDKKTEVSDGLKQSSPVVLTEKGPTDGGLRDETRQTGVEKQEETTEVDVKSESLLDSCTLVEGLLFPAEYYVRTTRRMTLSQSQPDMRAVILCQLSSGRRPRRGRGQRSNSQARQIPAELSSNSEHSGTASIGEAVTQAFSPPVVAAAHPGRGRKRRRGRGRGSNLVHRCSASPTVTPASPQGSDSLKSVSTASEHQQATPPEMPGSQKVFPIFMKSSQTVTPTPTPSGAQNWRSLLLPSPRLSAMPLLSLFTPPVSSLMKFELHQDFHLPDDQFASLKLKKLRQAAVGSGVESFASPSYNTRSGVLRRCGTQAEPLELPLSLTPTLVLSPPCGQSQQVEPTNTDPDYSGSSRSDAQPSLQEQTDCLCGDPRLEAPPTCEDNQGGVAPAGECLKRSPKEVKNKHSVHSQLHLSPLGASAPPHPHSSALPSSPMLPSLGVTPLAAVAALPLASNAPSLSLSAPHSPSSQAFSPATLSPHPKAEEAGPHMATSTTGTQKTEAVEDQRRCTLKAPAGGRLVDACCLLDSDGQLCVAAAGKWAVCLWSREASSSYAWTLRHTWTFSEPVINVFPVPDASGLVCVTLGQLEIREVRVLSCRGLQTALLCDGGIQVVVGVARSRVVTSGHTATGPTLEALTLSHDGSVSGRRLLGSPVVCVGALAPVDGLPDALIGTDEEGRLFVWNVKSGHLLQTLDLSGTLSHTSCLRGYSYGGVLLVLVQHPTLSAPQQEDDKRQREKFLKEEDAKKSSLFSLVAVNPHNAKSVLAARLDPPTSWSGRLCEADASGTAVAGVSQSGCVCVWGLRGPRWGAVTLATPEGEGWQLARWAEGGSTLVAGHQNGDVTLHFDLPAQEGFT
ncbi:partner and localizer of BRCA2 [Nerophis lumbriciformis]|uniref:partner and localizer of BRCA2 n=1 Tax=Nerophis lumbriciformis TaxID=546530 RepID=UPI002AE036B8|nr:partner and localizer of BRCA2 [Nerophis lumbriciformis]